LNSNPRAFGERWPMLNPGAAGRRTPALALSHRKHPVQSISNSVRKLPPIDSSNPEKTNRNDKMTGGRRRISEAGFDELLEASEVRDEMYSLLSGNAVFQPKNADHQPDPPPGRHTGPLVGRQSGPLHARQMDPPEPAPPPKAPRSANWPFGRMLSALIAAAAASALALALVSLGAASSFLGEYSIPPWMVLVAFGAGGFYLKCELLKRKLVALLPATIKYVQAELNDFLALDRITLKNQTEELTSLGFVPATDYCREHVTEKEVSRFSRLFIHPTHKCYAELSQTTKSGASIAPVRCAVISCFKGGWSMTTSNAQATIGSYAIRSPMNAHVTNTKAGSHQLLQSHLDCREHICGMLGTHVSAQCSIRSRLTQAGEDALETRARLTARSAVRYCLELDLFARKPQTEWMGQEIGAAIRKAAKSHRSIVPKSVHGPATRERAAS
jgi:hypothetical protein